MSLNLILIVILTACVYLVEVTTDVPAKKHPSTTPNTCDPCVCSVTNESQTIAKCSNRNLKNVPSTIPRTINIILIDHNKMSNLSSGEFSRFENLTHLDISSNKIKHMMNDSFRGLTHLKCLHMEGNFILAPARALYGLHSLKELYLDGSKNMKFSKHFLNMSNLTTLSMSGNRGNCKIGNINNDTFKYVPHLKQLDVSRCHLYNIDFGSFLPLRDIEELDISNNKELNFRNFESATYGLVNSSIKVLKANGIVKSRSFCNKLLLKHTQYLKKTRLQKLYFNHNRLEIIESGTFFNFPDTLWYITARYSRFDYNPQLVEMLNMTGVTHLCVGQGKLNSFPKLIYLDQDGDESNVQCESKSESICQPSRQKHLEYNSVIFPSLSFQTKLPFALPVIVPPNLEIFEVISVPLNFDIPWIKFTPNKITTLNVKGNVLSKWIGPVEGLKQLKVLQLYNNFANNVSTFFFSSFPNLQVLNISLNFIGSMMNKKNESYIFDNLKSLKVLDMYMNDIHSLPEDIFRDLISLEVLNLSHNALYLDMPLRVAQMKNLQLLDITNNDIRWFSKRLMQDLDSLNNITIYMRTNTLSCTCKNLEFLHWMKSTKVIFIDVHEYTCAFENQTFSKMGTFEDTVTRLEQECTNHLGLILGSGFVVILGLIIISGAIAYRYRWNLRYWYYAARLKLKEQSLLDSEDGSFTFDAFVSHADKDEDFVVNDMRNRIELQAGMNLNIHDRDFVPGQEIASNILSAIQGSRKTVVVLSRYFLESYWCMYELQMANMETIRTGRDVLIIIMYEDISTKEIPKEVLYHLKTESYIGYPHNGDEDQLDLFWRRLVAALKNN